MNYSERIHKEYYLGDFKLTGDLEKDADRYMEQKGIPSWDEKYNLIRGTALFRISFGEDFIVNTLTDGVVKKIMRTRIGNVPQELPLFMQKFFFIEARPNKVLFSKIQSIGGFNFNNEIYLIFETDKEILYSQTFSKSFDGRKLEDVNMMYYYDEKNDPPDTIEMKERKDILSFVVALSLLMEVKKPPFIIETDTNNKRKAGNKVKHKEKTDWIVRRIYIDKNVRYKNKKTGNTVLDKEGKHLKDTSVHGFLRQQRCGKGLTETEWVYIEDYDSKRWVSSGDTRIVVDIYDK
jgi:hypothetical protein